ncbi:unnamed protein product [Rhodiola kirilowii]
MTNTEGAVVVKPEALWTDTDEKASVGNAKVMNAIFSGVDENVFKLIANYEIVKEAWDILRTAYEGTDKVRHSRMPMVTTKFEDLRMKEDETIPEYNVGVLDLSNKAAALGKPIDDERMERKVLRSLPPRFAMKVTAIEEVHDLATLKLEDLTGSLRTYELNQLQDYQPKGGKGIALKAEILDDKYESGYSIEQLAMMAQNFGRMVRRINRHGPEQGQSSSSNFRNWKKGKTMTSENMQEFSTEKGKDI